MYRKPIYFIGTKLWLLVDVPKKTIVNQVISQLSYHKSCINPMNSVLFVG